MIVDDSKKPLRTKRKRGSSAKSTSANTQNEATSDLDSDKPAPKVIITELDDMDSLRSKFPRASPFELEFMMFLRATRS